MNRVVRFKPAYPFLAPPCIANVRGITPNSVLMFRASRRRRTAFCCLNSTPQTASVALFEETSSPPTAVSDELRGTQTLQPCIGIVGFLQGKNYLVTGATGFVAKAFVEKLLRTVPDVGKIFLLIKARDQEAARERLYKEIINSDLFVRLKQMHGRSYESFMEKKLVPVAGSITSDNLGLDPEFVQKIANEVNVIVNSAANTNFEERYDVALDVNVQGLSRLLCLAKKCNKLCLFFHFSTAYVIEEKEGTAMEKPIQMRQSVAAERVGRRNSLLSFPVLDIDDEIRIASRLVKISENKEVDRKLKELGLERAKLFGWQNTYTFTKAMGEMVINDSSGDFPIVIVRPSVIESSYSSPFPGWIQGIRMMDPLILSYGKGYLPGFFLDPQTIVDVVPVDMVVNASMAAMAKHGLAAKPGRNLYNVTSSCVNPLYLGDVFELSYNHFVSYPLRDSSGAEVKVSRMQFYSSMEDYSSFITNAMAEINGLNNGAADSDPKLRRRLEMKCRKKVEYTMKMVKVYEPFLFYRGRFDSTKMQELMKDMSAEEMRVFGFDFSRVDWEHYIIKIHIPGLKKYVMKEI